LQQQSLGLGRRLGHAHVTTVTTIAT
jgi:hypothetical protein